MRRFAWILLFLTAAQNDRKAFEVASIKPNASVRASTSMTWPKGRLTATNNSVQDLLIFAYSPTNGPRLEPDQIVGGPKWIAADRFDIEAKYEGEASHEVLQVMVRSLLEDRFRLTLHRDKREMPIYNLVIAKDGLKMKPSTDAPAPPTPSGRGDAFLNVASRRGGYGSTTSSAGITTFKGTAAPFSALVSMLQGPAGRPVIDKTGLQGLFDFDVQFSVNLDVNAPQQSAPSLFSALQEQLGLRLESGKGPGEVLVIDRLEKPSGN
jgi:bla regulator protein blaR1